MATFETKISGEVGELDKGALPVEVNNNDVATPEKESNGSEAVISRERALRNLREIALKDPSYEMDGNEIGYC